MEDQRLKAAADNISPNMWLLLENEQAGPLPDGELVRYLTCMNKPEADAYAALLRDYTDPTNYGEAADLKCWVENPIVGPSAVVEGVWRNGGVSIVRYDGQTGQRSPSGGEWRIIQTLKKGFLTALPYADARLIQTRTHSGDAGVNGQERYLTLEWIGVSPDALETLSKAKSTTAVIDGLQYRKVQHDGTTKIVNLGDGWHHLAVIGELAPDGSGTVRWLVADPEFILVGFSSWLGSRQSADTYYYNMPEALAQGVIDAAKARGADAGPSGYNDQQGLINIRVSQVDLTGVSLNDVSISENCDQVSTASFLWGTGNSALLPIPGSIAAGVSYDRNLSEGGDGSFSIVLRKQTRKYRDLTEYTAEHRADRTEARKEWKGWTNQSLGTALNAQSKKVVRVNKVFREDCSVDIGREVITPVAQSGSWTFSRGTDPDGTVYWGQNVDPATSPTAETAFADWLTALTGRVSPSIRINEYELLDYAVTVAPLPSEYESVPNPFSNYSDNFPIGNIVERISSGGKTYTKTYTGCKMYVAGNSDPDDAGAALATCDYKVSFNAMGNGRFFHAKGIELGETTGWELEGDLPTS